MLITALCDACLMQPNQAPVMMTTISYSESTSFGTRIPVPCTARVHARTTRLYLLSSW
jgi:hypothetical protein